MISQIIGEHMGEFTALMDKLLGEMREIKSILAEINAKTSAPHPPMPKMCSHKEVIQLEGTGWDKCKECGATLYKGFPVK